MICRSLMVLVGFSCLVMTSCSKKTDAAKQIKVSGTVKVDGVAITSGKITFDPGTGLPPGDMNIVDGKYEGTAPVGKCKVSITWLVKQTPKSKSIPDGPGYDQAQEVNILPERYNTKTELVREVTEPGPHTFDFVDLKGQ